MSALYAPAIPIVTSECSSREYQNKMVLDTASSKSSFHPENCSDPRADDRVFLELKLGADTCYIWANRDCEESLLVHEAPIWGKR